MTEILYPQHYAYTWQMGKYEFLRGYFFLNDTLYKGKSALDFLGKIEDFFQFQELLPQFNGVFSIILKRGEETWFAIDRARSLPLFYSNDGSFLSSSAEEIRREMGLADEDVDMEQLSFAALSEFTLFRHTMYKEISQLNLAEVGKIKGGEVICQPYAFHISEEIQTISQEDVKPAFSAVLDQVAERMVKAIGGRRVLLSLSGGYDSRYVAFLLKKHGIENVVCYTYGAENSYETKISKEIARKLGYEWYCVEYNPTMLKSILEEGEDEAFLAYCKQHSYGYYIQNYYALRELKKRGILQKDMVAVTGLCGDMPSGAYVKQMISEEMQSVQWIAKNYLQTIFRFVTVKKEFFEDLQKEVIDYLHQFPLEPDTPQHFTQINDAFETECRHSRCFLNMNFTHEFFGLEFLLPLWDKDFLSFWYSMPMELRYRQKLYEDYLINVLTKPYGIGYPKEEKQKPSIHLNPLLDAVKHQMGAFLVHLCFKCNRPFLRGDVNGFSSISFALYQRLEAKISVCWKRSNFLHLWQLYTQEKKYGKETVKKLREYIR